MPYFSYYLMWIALGWLLREPLLFFGVVVFFVLRPILPDPGRLYAAWLRLGPLHRQVDANPSNATARLELARLYLDLRRPKRALTYLLEARRRFPDDAELLFTSGQALLALRRFDEAIATLDAALASSPRVRFGLPYLVKGDAHFGARRWLEAAHSYEEYLESNSSSVEGYVRLAKAALRLGRRQEAKAALLEGVSTYRELQGGTRRRAAVAWLQLQWLRATRFLAPGPLLGFVLAGALLAAAGYVGFQYFQREQRLASEERQFEAEMQRMGEAFEKCGSVDLSAFSGVYSEHSRTGDQDGSERTSEIRIERGRVLERMFGAEGPLAEWCLTQVRERTPTSVVSEAVVHEDVEDPGDAWTATVRLEKTPMGVRFETQNEDSNSVARELVRK